MYSTQSMEMQESKLNNKGFSLLEVLVAVIILSIVSIPIIRSFATVAKTNADAKILLRATDGAENMMENLEYRTLEELVDRYDDSAHNTVSVDADGKHEIVIKDVADIPVTLPDGYYMTIVADPGLYPNANALNVSDVKSMSIADTAVYEMSQLYDAGVYETFDGWNKEAHDDRPSHFQRVNTDYFKENLTRTIEVEIDKKGTEGEGTDKVDLVTVNLKIRYYFRTKDKYKSYLPEDQKEYVETTREIFNNLSTKEPLSGIFVLYQPRYLATAKGNKDNIIIRNPENVKTNVMIAAQWGAADAVSYKTGYFNAVTGPNVTVIENPDGGIANAIGAITLLTNLSSEAPYSSLSGTDGKILCNLTYQNEAGTAKIKGDEAVKALDGRDLDGKALIADNTKNRIYKVTVTVWDDKGNRFVELDGTKLE